MQKSTFSILIFGLLAFGSCTQDENKQNVLQETSPEIAPVNSDPATVPVPEQRDETSAQAETPAPDLYEDPENAEAFLASYQFPPTHNPIVLSTRAGLYAEPDTGSAVVNILKFSTPLKITGIIKPDEDRDPYKMWYRVQLQDGQKGYVLAAQVATHVFTGKNKEFSYLVLQDISPRNPEPKYKVIKYDFRRNKALDSIAFHKGFRGALLGVEGEFQIDEIQNSALVSPEILLRFNENMDFCGGGNVTQFLAHANGKFILFPSTHASYDDGSADYEFISVYLPVKTAGDSISLHGNGFMEDRLNFFLNSEVKVFPWTADIGIPAANLVVSLTETGEAAVNKKGEVMENKDGSVKYKSIRKTATYYHWNGKRLTIVKSVPFNG